MAIQSGTHLGPYEILSAIGAGGQTLAFVSLGPAGGIFMLRMSDRKPQPFLQTKATLGAPQFSPDGHWLAYASGESGRLEIYVKPYPGPGGRSQISAEGGTEPQWTGVVLP